MNGGNAGSPDKAKDETKRNTEAPQAAPETYDDSIAPDRPQSDLVLRKLRDVLEKNEVTPDLERDMGMSRSDMEQFVKKYEKKQAEANSEPGRTIEAKPGDQPSSDKPSSSLSKIDRRESFSTKSNRDRDSTPTDQVRDNIEGVRFQIPPELRGKYEGYVNRLSRSRGTSKASRPSTPVSP